MKVRVKNSDVVPNMFLFIFVSALRAFFLVLTASLDFYGLNNLDDIIVVIFQTLINCRTTKYIIGLLFRQPITLSQLTH